MSHYGDDSIYLVRPLYTLYTAKLHDETIEASMDALNHMARLYHDESPVTQNQYLYKAILIDAMLQM